jgi:hypothetical protein
MKGVMMILMTNLMLALETTPRLGRGPARSERGLVKMQGLVQTHTDGYSFQLSKA